MLLQFFTVLMMLCLALLPAPARAQQPAQGSAAVPRPVISEQERADVQKFVTEHHPELSTLLTQLQKSRPAEYERAIRELVTQTQAILRLKERSPARYESQLTAWKVDSQIRILMARWSRKNDAETEARVRSLIAERQQLRREQVTAEKQRLSEQLQKLNDQLQDLDQPEPQRVQTEWEQLSRRAATAAKLAEKQKSGRTAASQIPAGKLKQQKSEAATKP